MRFGSIWGCEPKSRATPAEGHVRRPRVAAFCWYFSNLKLRGVASFWGCSGPRAWLACARARGSSSYHWWGRGRCMAWRLFLNILGWIDDQEFRPLAVGVDGGFQPSETLVKWPTESVARRGCDGGLRRAGPPPPPGRPRGGTHDSFQVS